MRLDLKLLSQCCGSTWQLEFAGPMHLQMGGPMMMNRGMTLAFTKKGVYRLGTQTGEIEGRRHGCEDRRARQPFAAGGDGRVRRQTRLLFVLGVVDATLRRHSRSWGATVRRLHGDRRGSAQPPTSTSLSRRQLGSEPRRTRSLSGT